MIRSMTGFGKAVRQFDGQTISVEVSSVNHRYLDSSLRIPTEWSALDPDLREALREHIARGKLSITVNRRRGALSASAVKFDPKVAQQYIDAAHEIGHLTGKFEKMSVNTLALLNGVFYYEDDEEEVRRVRRVLLEGLEDAIRNLNAMREAEGRALADDMMQRLDFIRGVVERIEGRLPELNATYEERLRSRLRELNQETSVTEERLAIEVALMAEKGDVTEETVRLKSHLDHMTELLQLPEPVGRKLNFLSQEIQREVNTLGAKVRDCDVARAVLEIKSEVEKIREQVQNVE